MLEKFYKVFNFFIIIAIMLLTLGSAFYQHYLLDKKNDNNMEAVKFIDKDSDKLKNKGYTNEEIKYIANNKELLKIILQKEYNKLILNLAKEKYFIIKNLDRYLTYQKSNPNYSLNKVVAMVNVNRDSNYYTNTVATDTSKGNLILVNKYYHLSESYTPDNLVKVSSTYAYGTNSLVKEVYDNYIKMYNDATKENLKLIINSSYRKYNYQDVLWNRYKSNKGESWADSVSARPGYSEHQTGLTLDIGTTTTSLDDFENTKEFDWVVSNAHKYGFIIRYNKGSEDITGYSYEPWHIRYVGKEVATKIKKSNITFDEYYAYFVK